MMIFPALYAIVVGLLIFGQWAFFLVARQVPELKTERMRVLFHIADEFLTAAVLIAFQLALNHWFYLYLPWVLPFVLLWLLLPERPKSYGNGTRTDSMDEARPDSGSHSISAPSIRTSP